jgi:beta-glucuronidase
LQKLAGICSVLVLPALVACGDGVSTKNTSNPASTGLTAAADCDVLDQHSGEGNPLRQSTHKEPLHELAPLFANVRSREHESLNGQWNYIVDQLNVGDNSVLLRGGVGENEKYGPQEILEYAFSDRYSLSVPGDWNTQAPELLWYRGVVWYQKEFLFEPVEGERTHLYFAGANYRKDVYVNGQLLARHQGGFTPFAVEVTPYLKSGMNNVVVKVDSMSGPTEVPTEYNDWKSYGGITRDVLLVKTPPRFVRNFKLQLKADQPELLAGWVEVDGARRGETVTLSIPELNLNREFKLDGSGRAEFEFAAEVARWSPESPKLYNVTWALGEVDVLKDQVGFRTIAVAGDEILLNDKPVFLRGISMHEESLLTTGRAHSQAEADAAVALLKDLNANYVRLAHYPHNEYMVRAAERAGIMVWSELPVYHDIQFANGCTLAGAKRQFSELIARDQNRAAVVLWSLGNETPVSDARNQFFQALADHVRAEDPTRPLAAALLTASAMEEVGFYLAKIIASKKSRVLDMVFNPDPMEMVIDDPLGEIVDVVGVNVYLGWYLAGPFTQELKKRGIDISEGEVRSIVLEEMTEFTLTTPFQKPVVISEVGAGGKYGLRGGPLDAWTEDLQANIYRHELQFVDTIASLRGISPWILKDFRSPYRINTAMQDYWNRKGLVSEKGEKKLAFQVLSDYYRQRAAQGQSAANSAR